MALTHLNAGVFASRLRRSMCEDQVFVCEGCSFIDKRIERFQGIIPRIPKSENRIVEELVKEIADLRTAKARLHGENPAPA